MDRKEAKDLITLARLSIEKGLNGERYDSSFKAEEKIKNKFSFKRGVFTSIYNFPEKTLRGCIGIPFPLYPLWKAVVISAYESAFEDPRFSPLRKDELNRIVIEITVLTEPEKLEGEPYDYINQIDIGKHGLMVQRGIFKGLLLPQVAVEWGFDEEQFLSETCIKAGLSPDAWKDEDTSVFKFSGILIKEKEPSGEIELRDLSSL